MFIAITKNLNFQVLTKNLVTFKRYDGVKDEKFWYYGSLPIFRGGGGSNKQYIGEIPKKEA